MSALLPGLATVSIEISGSVEPTSDMLRTNVSSSSIRAESMTGTVNVACVLPARMVTVTVWAKLWSAGLLNVPLTESLVVEAASITNLMTVSVALLSDCSNVYTPSRAGSNALVDVAFTVATSLSVIDTVALRDASEAVPLTKLISGSALVIESKRTFTISVGSTRTSSMTVTINGTEVEPAPMTA